MFSAPMHSYANIPTSVLSSLRFYSFIFANAPYFGIKEPPHSLYRNICLTSKLTYRVLYYHTTAQTWLYFNAIKSAWLPEAFQFSLLTAADRFFAFVTCQTQSTCDKIPIHDQGQTRCRLWVINYIDDNDCGSVSFAIYRAQPSS